MCDNGFVLVQIFETLRLQTVKSEHGDWAESSAAVGKVVHKTLPAEATIAGLDDRILKSLVPANASTIVVVRKKD